MDPLPTFLGVISLLGVTLVVFARRLSLAYNGWTARARQRNPRLGAVPTSAARERNLELVSWIFRLGGAFKSRLPIFTWWRVRG
ncbi:MAG: hypothetical protein IPJ65_29635 [Archangiaceae bacterium]|nr:hypothetical protein [Archangiaceae bacterium]